MYQRSSGVGKYGSGNLYPYPDRGSVQMTSAEHQNFACNLRKGGGGDWRGYYSSNVLVRERGRLCETPTQYVDFRGINVTPIKKLKSLAAFR